MIRRVALLAALMAATAGSAYAAACLPSGLGPVLNGFETTGSACTIDFPQWTTAATTWDATASPLTAVQGSSYGWAAADATTISLTLTTAASPAFAANNDWTSPDYNYIFVAYASSTPTATNFYFEYQFINSSSVNPAGFQTANKLTESVTPPWTYLVTSLNYVRNLGFDTSNVTQIRLEDFGPVFATNLGIAYDDLQLDPATGTLDTPNVAVPTNQAGGTPSGCGTSFTLTWTAQTQSGTDAISGYHVYRSVSGPTGPWVSDGYVVGAGSGTISYTDIVAGMSTNQYYIILPYASQTTAFGGGATGYFTGCNDNALDQHWVVADGGVNEAALNNADAVGPFNALNGCTPTDTPTSTPSPTPSLTATPSATPSPTPSDSPTATPSFTRSPSPTGTPTESLTYTETNTPPPTNTPGGPTNTETYTPANTNTPVPTNTPVNTNTPGPTNTPTVYVSPTPAPTITYVQLYPNPFYPDRGQVSHLGPVPAGLTWSVFDIIGKFVYKATTTGNPALDVWYGYNADGMECSTGIYFLVMNGKIYRIGLVRN